MGRVVDLGGDGSPLQSWETELDPERERSAWGRARNPLAIAACDDFMTSMCMSHCGTPWVREKTLSLGKDFILARHKGGHLQIPEAAL